MHPLHSIPTRLDTAPELSHTRPQVVLYGTGPSFQCVCHGLVPFRARASPPANLCPVSPAYVTLVHCASTTRSPDSDAGPETQVTRWIDDDDDKENARTSWTSRFFFRTLILRVQTRNESFFLY
jgi:hypothetical protein